MRTFIFAKPFQGITLGIAGYESLVKLNFTESFWLLYCGRITRLDRPFFLFVQSHEIIFRKPRSDR